MVRIDRSEFFEKHSLARLNGTPPGDADADKQAKAVRRRAYSVALSEMVFQRTRCEEVAHGATGHDYGDSVQVMVRLATGIEAASNAVSERENLPSNR